MAVNSPATVISVLNPWFIELKLFRPCKTGLIPLCRVTLLIVEELLPLAPHHPQLVKLIINTLNPSFYGRGLTLFPIQVVLTISPLDHQNGLQHPAPDWPEQHRADKFSFFSPVLFYPLHIRITWAAVKKYHSPGYIQNSSIKFWEWGLGSGILKKCSSNSFVWPELKTTSFSTGYRSPQSSLRLDSDLHGLVGRWILGKKRRAVI